MASSLTVGERVRVALPNSKACRRGIIATIQDDGTASILLEEPVPPAASFAATSVRTNVTAASNDDDMEVTVPKGECKYLLDFEAVDISNQDKTSVAVWKDCGDQLLKLGDASAAIDYYQAGLQSSSRISIGSTVILKENGFTKLAEVDCIDGDGSLDVSLLDDDTELTIRTSQVLLSIMSDDKDRLQERFFFKQGSRLLASGGVDFDETASCLCTECRSGMYLGHGCGSTPPGQY